VFLNRDTLEGALDPLPDVLVDAIDSLGPKAGLLAGAVSRGCRVVSSMGAAMRRDSTAVRVDDLWNTRHCPLARFLRKRLRRLGVSGPIRCVYSLEPVARHALAASDAAETDWRGRTRNTLGSVSYLTGLFGLLAAEAALEFLLNSQPQ
jgi:tRNA A37 threonylcarbamoyladenosine dehydratase